jgi:hypothetical protein
LIPAFFSIGYGSAFLVHNPNLAEGVPVENAPFVVRKGMGLLDDNKSVLLVNGGFEDFSENLRFPSDRLHGRTGDL